MPKRDMKTKIRREAWSTWMQGQLASCRPSKEEEKENNDGGTALESELGDAFVSAAVLEWAGALVQAVQPKLRRLRELIDHGALPDDDACRLYFKYYRYLLNIGKSVREVRWGARARKVQKSRGVDMPPSDCRILARDPFEHAPPRFARGKK